jgi:hypothetical protein
MTKADHGEVVSDMHQAERTRHARVMDNLLKLLQQENQLHKQETQAIHDKCLETTGHKDNGGMFYGFCEYCGEILE